MVAFGKLARISDCDGQAFDEGGVFRLSPRLVLSGLSQPDFGESGPVIRFVRRPETEKIIRRVR
ncbi:hypothetical protein ZHAS_00021371 [Anopheles sinensis]|uniref:Uncharacterized protein n=1 Tax=Anopheles sinensis TaxID=74873 RepID=A0A084WS82_ANOSI|nr:hypothetical protein ZHAS_00021371 [Anopheles sinensis]